jgi:predicted metalloprotease with PDZ domain
MGLISILAYSPVYAEMRHISYELSYSHPAPITCLNIYVKTTLDSTGKFSFFVPKWSFNHVSYMGKNGQTNYVDDTHIFTILDKPFSPVQFSYDLCPVDPARDLRTSIIDKEYIFLDFLSALIFPSEMTNWKEKWDIEFELKNLPAHFNFYSSYPIENKKIKITETWPRFLHTALWATKNVATSIIVNKKQVDFIYIGENKKKRKKLEIITKKLMIEQRKFWQDDDFKQYSAIFLDNELQKSRGNLIGKNATCFFSYLVDDLEKEKADTIHQISHELFHAWLGDKISFAPYPSDLTWFVEGFTDYYGQKLAQKSGLLSSKEVKEIFNRQILAYYQLPIKNETQETFLSSGYKDPMYYSLNLLKGYFIAAWLDRLKNPKGDALMPLILREILATYSKQAEENLMISKELVFEVFSKYISEDEMFLINSIIVYGKTIEFTPNFTMGEITKLKEKKVPDFGFDLNELITNRTIKNLKSDSAAFRAGLRNEMKVLDHNFRLIKTNQEIKLQALTKQGSQEFYYFPEIKVIKVPQL